MRSTKPKSWSIFLFMVVLLTACNGLTAVEPTITLTPSWTVTSIPSSTPTITVTTTPTTTPTLPPTETPDPRPASLTGTISLSGDTTEPFISSVEIRQAGSFDLIGKTDTDSNADYKIEDIAPGTYELWVLITTKKEMVSTCTDIAPPDDMWRMGIIIREGQAITIGNAYLSKALSFIQSLEEVQRSDAAPQGFFAVLPEFTIEGGIENRMDVTLLCK